MEIAGLWSWWKSPQREVRHSFTVLTINADAHPLMRLFHRPTDEKRMVVILPMDRYDTWNVEATARPQLGSPACGLLAFVALFVIVLTVLLVDHCPTATASSPPDHLPWVFNNLWFLRFLSNSYLLFLKLCQHFSGNVYTQFYLSHAKLEIGRFGSCVIPG